MIVCFQPNGVMHELMNQESFSLFTFGVYCFTYVVLKLDLSTMLGLCLKPELKKYSFFHYKMTIFFLLCYVLLKHN